MTRMVVSSWSFAQKESWATLYIFGKSDACKRVAFVIMDETLSDFVNHSVERWHVSSYLTGRDDYLLT